MKIAIGRRFYELPIDEASPDAAKVMGLCKELNKRVNEFLAVNGLKSVPDDILMVLMTLSFLDDLQNFEELKRQNLQSESEKSPLFDSSKILEMSEEDTINHMLQLKDNILKAIDVTVLQVIKN